MSIAALVRRMSEAGAPAEAIALAIEEIEAVQASLDARRFADRDRKRAQRERQKTAEVTGQSEDSHETVTPKGSLEVSPHTPLPKPSKSSPLNPPKSEKRMIPADWTPPPVSELPPRARACAEMWTDASYQTQAEGFLLYWRNERKMRPDWTATWANWVIRLHSQVMRDQKFGNAPTDTPKARHIDPEQARAMSEGIAKRLEGEGRLVEAQQYRARCAAQMRVSKPREAA